MEHYISKSDVLKEIEKLVDKGKYHEELDCAYCGGKNAALYALKGRINALEPKEVDLEEYIDDFISMEHRYVEYETTWINEKDWRDSIKRCAKEFFELGLKAKGE